MLTVYVPAEKSAQSPARGEIVAVSLTNGFTCKVGSVTIQLAAVLKSPLTGFVHPKEAGWAWHCTAAMIPRKLTPMAIKNLLRLPISLLDAIFESESGRRQVPQVGIG